MTGQWQFWVDRGGTFTDVVARDPAGALHVAKLLSEDPGRYADAAVAAMRRLTGVDEGPLPAAELRIGTTVATNALLERKGEPALLAITRGFGDALRIGTQERPDIFAREIVLPVPLYAEVAEIDERIGADGEVVSTLDEAQVLAALQARFDGGLRSVAVVLMHGYRFSAHEAAVARIAREIGFTQVSVSHEVAPLIKLIGRGDTTLVDAYLSPVLRRYVEGLLGEAGGAVEALFMQSSGGLAGARAFRGKDAVLSGPAGGIIGMARTAEEAGFDHVIGFDMGGTSTDVSHYAGHFERDGETRVGGARIRTPMLRIHTVAAGGGSICGFDGVRFFVGPHSAGAVPGPACYRRGGPLTVTDCNLALGKIVPDQFPRVFGPDGDQPLDGEAVRARLNQLCGDVAAVSGRKITPEAAAEGFVAIAVANMANAIKAISVGRGHDVTRYTLACFGGAGGQHACLVAAALGMSRVVIHPLAGVLSAYGMGLAERRELREKTVALPLAEAPLDAEVAALGAAARGALASQGVAPAAIRIEATALLRFGGADSTIEVALGDEPAMRAEFASRYAERFGFAGEGEVIAETLRVEAVAAPDSGGPLDFGLPAKSKPPLKVRSCFMAGAFHETPLYRREDLAAGFALVGPAIVVDASATTVIEPGWTLTVDRIGNLILENAAPHAAQQSDDLSSEPDPVRLEIMSGLFMAIAEEMGAALQHSATSVNIRERLDFSCALFDCDGNLIANAPHMPVHLGSMGESVRVVRRRAEAPKPGDAWVLNAPYEGGTHLPDITVVMPVFVDGGVSPSFWVAARGHHADVGGISPGSMPPASTSVEEEGVLLDCEPLVRGGRFLEAEIATLLGSGAYPSRNVALNIADLKAQVAACARGAAELQRLCRENGERVVAAYMSHVQAHAEAAVRKLIGRLDDGAFRYEMDSGAEIVVKVTLGRDRGEAIIDFTGSSPQRPDNFNAPVSVVRAAVLYVVRTLIDDAIPMNEGCLRPITLVVPEGTMLSPRWPAAVVAGNVETSQAVTDALFGALGAMAAAQGTMNNFTFGNDAHQYYETIAGGSGAGPGFAGTAVVQTHMTNSRLTDPEILETRFPVRLEAFAIRPGSGGAGRWRGGDGAVRRVRFLEPMTAGILANRRRVPPFGLAGGADGDLGRNRVERADGSVENYPATATVEMDAGDCFVIETPGGGGFGKG
ncbi:MAG: hydantoinase B/oxoprolinase family protein [Novosphingobium sp.]